MKKSLVFALMMVATSVFAEGTVTPKSLFQQQQQSSESQAINSGVSTGSNTNGSITSGDTNITFAAADGTTAAKAVGESNVTAALISAQAARDIAATAQVIKNTPSVNGPNLTTSNDTCMGSTSGSVNIAGLGIGGGTSWVDGNCKMLKNSREMWNMGMKAAALALMCTDAANMEALELTGFVCPQTAAKSKAAEAKAAPAKVSAADQQYTDPIVRARLGLEPLVAAK